MEDVEESNARQDPELLRYREAGASQAVRYRFPATSRRSDDFYCSEFMEDYSEGVLIEGDFPLDLPPDLTVFVAPPVPEGEPLLRQVAVDPQAERAAQARRLEEELQRIQERSAGRLPSELADFFVREALATRRSRTPDREERWSLAGSHRGIERAQVVVLNLRCPDERPRAEAMLAEIARLRSDEEVFEDVIGWAGTRIRITAGAADLSDPKDPALGRILRRIKRPFARDP